MIWLAIGTFLFHFLNITGFKVKSFVLVESCIKNEPQDIPFHIFFGTSIIIFFIYPHVGKWMLFGFFTLVTIGMIFTTIRFIIFPNEKKTKSYNIFFANTHHIIKPQEKRLIPDTYHIALLLMFPINLMMVIIYILYSS